MTRLFKDDTDTDQPPRPSTVRALEGFAYKAEAVRKWSHVKAETVLAACRREEAIGLQRAAAKATAEGVKTGDVPAALGEPSRLEREDAAGYIDAATGAGHDETYQALMYSVHLLTRDECRRLAGYLVKLFRGPA